MTTKPVESIKQGLSREEALVLTRLASQDKTIISLDDIQTAADLSYNRAKQMASNLVEKRWLDRLKPGTYLIVPLAAGETGEYTEHEFVIATHLADPVYISYWSALNHYGLTEQVPTTVFAATTEQVPTRKIHGVTYQFITLTEAKFFGYDTELIDTSHSVDIATEEKVLVDCADHPEHCGGITELAKAVGNADRQNIDWETVVDYLLKIENGAAIKRIVYIADLLDIELPRRGELEDGFTAGYSKLDPTRGDDGHHTSQYRLLVNVEDDKLRPQGELS